LFQLLEKCKKTHGERYQIIIDEFITLARNRIKEGVIDMNNDEFKKFIETYPFVAKYENAVVDKFRRILRSIKDRIVVESEELVQVNKEYIDIKYLPCLHISLKIVGWHVDDSAYIFGDFLHQNIGAVLTGYEDRDRGARAEFLERWEDSWKPIYKDNPRLSSFTWLDEVDNGYKVKSGYFKLVEGTSGELFNPQHMSECDEDFYWGYVYKFDLDSLKVLEETIAKDFRNLLDTFRPGLDTKRARRGRKS
jgi:hypothetical protein